MARKTWIKALAAMAAGVVLLTACGGGDSRTRNAAFIIDQENCWLDAAAKDGFLAPLYERRAELEAAAAQIPDAASSFRAWRDATNKALAEWGQQETNYEAAMATGDLTEAAKSEAAMTRAWTEYEKARKGQDEYALALQDLEQLAGQLPSLNDKIDTAEAKPLCIDLNDDGPELSVVPPSDDSELSEIPAVPETSPSTTPATVAAASVEECGAPVPQYERTTIGIGETVDFVVPRCGEYSPAIAHSDFVSAIISGTRSESKYTIVGIRAGSGDITFVHFSPEEQASSDPIRIPFTVVGTETSAPPTTASLVDATPCAAPVPREGLIRDAQVGDRITFTFDLCAQADVVGVRGQEGDRFEPVGYDFDVVERVVRHVFTASVAGEYIVEFEFASNASGGRVSDTSYAKLTVSDREVADPCEGKMPVGEWDGETDGGTISASSTCDEVPTVLVTFELLNQADVYGFRHLLADGESSNGWVSRYGYGDYQITFVHGQWEDDQWKTYGDTLTLLASYPEATEGTVSNGAVESERSPQPVTELPAAVFTPQVSEAPENSRATPAGVPVVALPAEAAAMTCNSDCLEAVLSRAGVESGTVEISLGDAPWTAVAESTVIAVPLEPTAVNLRVTPTDGEPVEMSAVFTRQPSSATYSETATKVVDTTAVPASTSDSSSFPWWIIALVVVLLAVGSYFERRRRTRLTTTQI